MSDIAQGGLNQAVISIEQARGALNEALDTQQQLQDTPTEPPGRHDPAARGREPEPGLTRRRRPADPRPTFGTLVAIPPPTALRRAPMPRAATSRRSFVQIRVLTAQPWEARGELLVVPIVGEPDFGGPLGELDTRTGGELRALAAFGELEGEALRHGARGARRGRTSSGSSSVSGGDTADFDRETARRLAATAIRRLVGREVTSAAVVLGPVADSVRRRRGARGRARRAGLRRGRVRAEDDLSRGQRRGAAGARRARAARGRARGSRRTRSAARSAAGSSARAPTSPAVSRTGPPTTSPRRSSPTRPAPSPRRTASRSTCSTSSRPRSSGWACSSRWGRGATTRRG